MGTNYCEITDLAVGTGVEPVRACAHEFSRLAHYRPARPPLSGGGGIRTHAGLAAQKFSELPQWTNYATPPRKLDFLIKASKIPINLSWS